MAAQYIFQMQGLTKAYPGNRKVFENIWLSFYPDAKIGVVGVNGSGKSTLLKIMAGIDTEFTGEARAAEGVKRGYLDQVDVEQADLAEAPGPGIDCLDQVPGRERELHCGHDGLLWEASSIARRKAFGSP